MNAFVSRGALAVGAAAAAIAFAWSTAAGADAAQVALGRQVDAANCAVCHGGSLSGGAGPSLRTAGLAVRYPSALRLFQFLRLNMPLTAPGSLSDAQYLDVTAYILDQRGVVFQGTLTEASAAGILLFEPEPPPVKPPPAVPTPTATPRPAAPPAPTGNSAPIRPQIWEPVPEPFRVEISPYFINLQSSPFIDPNSDDRHLATEFEIWDAVRNVRVWSATATDPPDQAALLTGTFDGRLTGRMGLEHQTVYKIRARQRDDSRDPATEWSAWSDWVLVLTAQQGLPSPKPMRVRDIRPNTFSWLADDGTPVVLPIGASVLLTGGRSDLHWVGGGADGLQIRDFAPNARHANLHFHIRAGPTELIVPPSRISFLDTNAIRRRVWVPFMRLGPGEHLNAAASAEGGFYFEPDALPIGDIDLQPLLITPTRAAGVPWRVPAGFRLELVADALTHPFNMAFLPGACRTSKGPRMYFTEFGGQVKALDAGGAVWTYAEGILNDDPLAPPSDISGQLGTSGIGVDPDSCDVFVSTVYRDDAGFKNKTIRFASDDGGRTAARVTDVLRLGDETTGPSHQIHALLFADDGTLFAAVGNGLSKRRGLDDNFFGGKIIRLNRDGSAPRDNPFFDPARSTDPISYQWAKGLRNDVGLVTRAGDPALYTAENGPALDRLLRITRGSNSGYDGTDASMLYAGLWWFGPPAVGPTGIAFASGAPFPPDRQGRLYVGTVGFTYVKGTADNGKEIWEFDIAPDGSLVAPPTSFVKYVGQGFANVVGVAYAADGLYFTEFFADAPFADPNPDASGARIWRVVPDPLAQPR